MNLADLTSPDATVAAGGGAVLAVPLGATEQHGPHLPLSTDTDLAIALCDQLARRRDVVVAPALAYGSSGEHAGFAGTLSIGQAAVELLIVELGRSATETFSRVLLVSGHGGNAEPVARAVATLRREGRDVHSWFPAWAGEPHAGRAETSLQLVLRPDSVLLARAEPGDPRPIEELMPLLRSGGVRSVAPNGVLGDPRGATANEGRRLLEALAVDLTRAVDSWLDRDMIAIR
jgi:mycofactocin precursor peptide peptidase